MIAESSNATSAVVLRSSLAVSTMTSTGIFGSEHGTTLHSERAAVRELSQITEDEHGSLTRFLQVAMKSCLADSAGITLMEPGATGKGTLRWHAVAGVLARHEGFAPPRSFSSCGTCLDQVKPLIFRQPQRAYPYLRDLQPAMADLLVVPLQDGAEQLGTVWMVQHDSMRSFCADDARVAERLALHLACALKVSKRETEHRHAIAYRDAQLRDAHHRVKNTLQIAASTLQLDAQTTASESARNALQIGSGRLQILAKVHELLGRETGSEQVAVHTLLQTVIDGARHSFVELSTRVELTLTAAPVWLPADQAMPIALLANEAVTNACKHAFPGDRDGEICVELSGSAEGALVLRIADDGVGMAKQRTKGLGLQLIAGFSEQLRGAISFSEPVDTPGTTVMLTLHRRLNRADIPQAVAEYET